MSGLVAVEEHQNRLTEAEKLLCEALEIQRRIVGPHHPDTLLLMNNLGVTLPSDSDLQPLRSDPRFNAIVTEATKRLATAGQNP